MTEQYGPYGLSYEKEQMRLHNIGLCEQYLALKGPMRNVERAKFCTDTGAMILPFAFGKDPRDNDANRVWKSFKELGEQAEKNGWVGGSYPDWELNNATIYSTPDPDLILIECDGEGMRYDKARRFNDLGYYKNHYILIVTFVNGKMDDVSEVFNTACVYNNYENWKREPRMF